MYDFIAIDFETANAKMDSACEIGIVAVKNLSIVKTFKSLIRPRSNIFNPDNVAVHGITAEMVEHEKVLDELWPELLCYFNPSVPVIAHNAAFDMSVLKESCSANIPDFYYADSIYIVAPFVFGKKTLTNCAAQLGIHVEQHHDAADDARVCAEICIEALKRSGCRSVWEYFCKNDVQIYSFAKLKPMKSVGHGSNKKFNREKLDFAKLQATSVADPNCPLCGKNVVFTGDLSISRTDAAQLAASHGAIVKSGVSSKTNYLVVGAQDKALVGDDGMSSKEEKAHALNESGTASIVFLSESSFFEMLDGNKATPESLIPREDTSTHPNETHDVAANCENEEIIVGQVSIFDNTDIGATEKQICDMLSRLVKENGLNGLPVNVYELKSIPSAKKHSISIFDNVIMRIYLGKKTKYLEFPIFQKAYDNKDKTYEKVYISTLSDVPDYFDRITATCQRILDGVPKDFSCCSRYMECSDAKICTNPDKMAAVGCYYRRVLHNGKVFYGANRNIE